MATTIDYTEINTITDSANLPCDLRDVANTCAANGTAWQAASYKMVGDRGPLPESGCVLYLPSEGRAGIAKGGNANWTDADSIEDAIERDMGIDGKEMSI